MIIHSMRYILFNKPYGVLSQFTDEGSGHPTLKRYIDLPDVYAAGRLDRDSEGLLLLTDDGALIRHLTDPIHHVEKSYYVMVEGEPTAEKLERLANGVELGGRLTRPAILVRIPDPGLPERPKPLTPHGPTAWLEVKLREGRKRQIRHMTASVGLFTLRIFRIALGGVHLQGLKPGQWRDLQPDELAALMKV